jgi:hypothetical protein
VISVNRANLTYPLVDDLYWVPGSRDSGSLYSASNFYFPSADFSRLIPATTPALVSALQSFIASNPTASCTPGLQAIVDALTASENAPAPRYPEVGDRNVKGVIEFAVGPLEIPHFTPGQPTVYTQIWAGHVRADIAENGYDTPPATLVEAWDPSVGLFTLQFSSTTALTQGQAVTFTIKQGKYAAFADEVTAQ